MNWIDEKQRREQDGVDGDRIAAERAAHDAGLQERIDEALRKARDATPPAPKFCSRGCGQLTTRVRWCQHICESCEPVARESPPSSFTRGMVRR